MATDFSMKQHVDPTAIAGLAQRQAEQQAQMDQQEKQRKLQELQTVAQSVGSLVSSSIEQSKQRQKDDMVKNLANSMAQRYAPNVSAPQMGPGLPTAAPAGPVAGDNAYQQGEQALPPVSTPDYAGQNAIKASVKANPDIWSKLSAEMLMQTPLQQAEAQQKRAQAIKDSQLVGPATQASRDLVTQLHKKLGTPAPDMSGMTEQQVNQYYDNGVKMVDKPSASNPGEVTDADRKRLAPLARMIGEYRAKDANALVSARGGEKEKLSLVLSEMYPNVNLQNYAQQVKMRNDYVASGTAGKQLTASNTAINHMDTLNQKISAIDNSDFRAYNSVANYMAKNVGKPEVAALRAAKNLVDNELGKVVAGSNGQVTDSMRKEFNDTFDSASSPAQARAVVQTYMDLMKGRVDTIKENWEQTMGDTKSPVPFVTPSAKKALIKYGYNPDTLEKIETKAAKTTKPVDLGNGFSYTVN